ncbi:MAG TPA: hypothetical protein VGF99_04070 [Myxococcota bacterium]
MRCVVLFAALFMLTPTASRADSDVLAIDSDLLALDMGLLQEVVDSVTSHGGQQASAGMPFVLALPAQNGGGARNLPPQLNGIGLGLQVGAPTAITIKFAGLQANGFVVGVGAGFAYGRRYYGYNAGFASLSIHADYLWHLATLVSNGDVALTFYAGVGLWLSLFGNGYGYGLVNPYYGNSYFGVGVRVPLGLSLGFSGAPVEVYLEADPAIFVFPGIDFGIGASLGFRWHF